MNIIPTGQSWTERSKRHLIFARQLDGKHLMRKQQECYE